MKNLLATIVFLFMATLFATAQDINVVDSNGKRQGKWIKYYDNGVKQYEGFFKDDHPVDTMKRYNNNGTLLSVLIYSEDGVEAYAYIYYDNGYLASEGNYINQQKDGLWKFYSSTNKDYLINEEYYSENLKNGSSVTYYTNKAIAEKRFFVYGKEDGERTKYYADGSLQMKAHYENGKLNGSFESWYSNGEREFQGTYKENLREGKWLMYDEDGKVKYEANYIKGRTDNRQMDIDASDELDLMEQKGKKMLDPANGELPF